MSLDRKTLLAVIAKLDAAALAIADRYIVGKFRPDGADGGELVGRYAGTREAAFAVRTMVKAEPTRRKVARRVRR